MRVDVSIFFYIFNFLKNMKSLQTLEFKNSGGLILYSFFLPSVRMSTACQYRCDGLDSR